MMTYCVILTLFGALKELCSEIVAYPTYTHITSNIIWPAPSENVPSSMRDSYLLCECAKYYLGLCSLLLHSVVSNDSVSGQGVPRSDCADAQADLGLHCPHMPKDTFSFGAAYLYFGANNYNRHHRFVNVFYNQ